VLSHVTTSLMRMATRGAPPTEAQDLRDQEIVLTLVLVAHQSHLIVPERVREITAGTLEFAEDDRMERAVRDLTGLGLLHCPGRCRDANQGGDSLQPASGRLRDGLRRVRRAVRREPPALP